MDRHILWNLAWLRDAFPGSSGPLGRSYVKVALKLKVICLSVRKTAPVTNQIAESRPFRHLEKKKIFMSHDRFCKSKKDKKTNEEGNVPLESYYYH